MTSTEESGADQTLSTYGYVPASPEPSKKVTGLGYLEAIAGDEARDILPRLRQGEALVFGSGISSESPVAIDVLQE